MATEVSIAKDLSGSEALESILFELRKILSQDGRFHSHKAYRGFVAKIHFEFRPAVGFTPPIDREIEISQGDLKDIEDSPTVDENLTVPMRPPNQVREDSDLPTPVLVTDNEGRTHEKWVNGKGARPRNTAGGRTQK